jgi:hypothetical protein
MSKSLLQKKIDYHNKLEGEIIDMLDNLENAGEECDCDNCTRMDFIHNGEWKEITTRCINCGGYVENI